MDFEYNFFKITLKIRRLTEKVTLKVQFIEIADKIFVINFTLSKGVSNAGIYHSSVYLLFNIFVV